MEQREFYEFHRRNRGALYSHHMIHSPGVPAFRDNDDKLLDEPYEVSLITSPAVNAGAMRKNEPDNVPRIGPVIRERIDRLLSLALLHGHETLVLGAWGCGVFRNDPRINRANLDGTDVEIIVADPNNLYEEVGLALDLDSGKLYWNGHGKIHRANLDGTDLEVLSLSVSVGPLAIDPTRSQLYFFYSLGAGQGQAIGKTDLDGANLWTLVTLLSAMDFRTMALDPVSDRLCWNFRDSSYQPHAIQCADLDSFHPWTTPLDDNVVVDGMALEPGPPTGVPATSPRGAVLLVALLLIVPTVALLRRRRRPTGA